MKVKLEKLLKELEMSDMEEMGVLIHFPTGECLVYSDDELRKAERVYDGEDIPLLEWEKPQIQKLLNFIEHDDDYFQLPSFQDLDEYQLMEVFAYKMNNDKLLQDLRGRGVFRRFKDNLAQFDLWKEWELFRKQAMKKVLIKWCEDHQFDFE